MNNVIRVILFIDSNCDNCRLMQHELMENPPEAHIRIVNVSRRESANIEWPFKNKVKSYPTTIVYTYPYPFTIATFEGFVDSKTIDETIQNYINQVTNK